MEKGKLVGWILIVLGALLILNSASGITGFAIAENINKTAGSIMGIVLVAGGALMLISQREQALKDRLEIIVQNYESGHIKRPAGAAIQIRDELTRNGRTLDAINYSGGKISETVVTNLGGISISGEDPEKMEDLALALYIQANRRGKLTNLKGLGREVAATKDYKRALNKRLEQEKYVRP